MEINYRLEEITKAAQNLLDFGGERKVFAFYGEMGAGKTTLIKHICNLLDVEDTVNSPTFGIINEYKTKSNNALFHFDFYRLKDVEEAIGIDAEEYFYSGAYCFLEWPEIIEPILPDDYLQIKITLNPDGSRTLTAE